MGDDDNCDDGDNDNDDDDDVGDFTCLQNCLIWYSAVYKFQFLATVIPFPVVLNKNQILDRIQIRPTCDKSKSLQLQ